MIIKDPMQSPVTFDFNFIRKRELEVGSQIEILWSPHDDLPSNTICSILGLSEDNCDSTNKCLPRCGMGGRDILVNDHKGSPIYPCGCIINCLTSEKELLEICKEYYTSHNIYPNHFNVEDGIVVGKKVF